MGRFLRRVVWIGLFALILAAGYGYLGFRDARADAPELAVAADALIADGRGGVHLGLDRRAMLLAVEDPSFSAHAGFDFTTPGAGITTLTQSLAKQEGFADFTPGLQKIRQTGYAIGLETRLSKPQILALWLDRAQMGRAGGPDAGWIEGFFTASQLAFGDHPARITEDEFLHLVAVAIAPATFDLTDPGPALDQRVARIRALLAGDCTPDGNSDVWLTACSGADANAGGDE